MRGTKAKWKRIPEAFCALLFNSVRPEGYIKEHVRFITEKKHGKNAKTNYGVFSEQNFKSVFSKCRDSSVTEFLGSAAGADRARLFVPF